MENNTRHSDEVLESMLQKAVNRERDSRVSKGFVFNGKIFDCDDVSKVRISGAASLAGFAISINGAVAGDYLWHGGDTPFVWISKDNSVVQLDAYDCLAFGKAAAEHERLHIFAAREIKESGLTLEYREDSRWPAPTE